MTEAEYNVAEGVRRSDLWKMDDSPEKYLWNLEHPMEQTPAMTFGSACHKMILEPEDFGNEYAVKPAVDGRTKEGKAVLAAFMEDHAGKTLISADDATVMADMEAALERCNLAKDLLWGEGQNEVPIFWADPETGEKCKAKCDRIITGEDGRFYLVDYKTTKSAETELFNHELWRLGYHMQAGMYAEGVMNALHLDYLPVFIFVAQEKKAPYAVNVIQVSEDVMKLGREKFHELLDKLHECKEADIWPGYVDDVMNETFVPGWMSYEEEEE